MNPNEFLRALTNTLKEAGIDSPRFSALTLLKSTLELPEYRLLLNDEILVSREEMERLKSAIARVCSGEPLDYVIGFKEFVNVRLLVDKRVLIPRPETEAGPVPSRWGKRFRKRRSTLRIFQKPPWTLPGRTRF